MDTRHVDRNQHGEDCDMVETAALVIIVVLAFALFLVLACGGR